MVANTASNTISVLLGFGNGQFLTRQTFDVGSEPTWIGIADLNADGKPDVVVVNRLSGTVQTFINRSP